jgi:RHS repeat-associated protein
MYSIDTKIDARISSSLPRGPHCASDWRDVVKNRFLDPLAAGVIVAISLGVLAPDAALAQQCAPASLIGTINPGDGSAPITPMVSYQIHGDTEIGPIDFPGQCCAYTSWGQFQHEVAYAGSWRVGASVIDSSGSPEYSGSWGDWIVCSWVNQCLQCSGSFDLQLYASKGNISGVARHIPSGQRISTVVASPTVPGAGYTAQATTDSSANFSFTRGKSPLEQANNWGVFVENPAVSGGAEYAEYMLGAYDPNYVEGPRVTTFSSENVSVVFEAKDPYWEEPAGRSCPAVGRPVSVSTGNVFFDQVDAEVLGVSGLRFVRSYNSLDRSGDQYGIFGPGWNHSYERRLFFPSGTDTVILRSEAGTPIYYPLGGYADAQATVPPTERSRLEKQPDGTYVRYFKEGGFERYNGAGRLTSSTDAVGNTITLTREPSGRLTRITDPGGRALTLAYSNKGLLSTLSGPAGSLATYTYDSSNRLKSVSYAGGSGYSFSYDSSHRLTSFSDAAGKTVETHTYDSYGRASTSEISGGREKYTLAYAPNTTTVTDALGNVTTYDWTELWGMKYTTRITGPCPSCGSSGDSQSWTYDAKGRVLTRSDGLGGTITYTYDSEGNRLSETDALNNTASYTYDSQGRVLSYTNAAYETTSYTYGAAGPLSITDPLGRVTAITYDSRGKAETVTDGRSKVTRFSYNASGDLISAADPLNNTTRYGYDALGRRTTTTDPLNNTRTTTYDGAGLVTRVTEPNSTHSDFTYDSGRRILSATDPLLRKTTYVYDAYGRLSSVTDPLNGVTSYSYDLMSHLASITDARGKVTSFTYDGAGRVTRVTYPGGSHEDFTYDAAGRLVTRTDRRGVMTTLGYDLAGQLTSKDYSDGSPPLTYSYDPVGRLATAANGVDTLTWTYDAAGELATEESARNASTVTSQYDNAGNRWSLSLDGQIVATYGYTDNGLLETMTHGTSVFGFGYDAASRRIAMGYPNNIVTYYNYDTLSRITNVEPVLAGTTTIARSSYVYDAAGNRTSKTSLDYAESYVYDAIHRVTTVKRGAPTTESYAYDLVGNRVSALNSSPWTYNNLNQLLSYPGVTFQYDANGNTTGKIDASGQWTYEWNAENQLTRGLRNGNEVARFAYDPVGRRVEKVAGGATITYTYDGEDILREASSTGVILKYLHGPGIDEPLAQENGSGALSYYHADGLGSIVKTTNSAGGVTASRRYNGFGILELDATKGYAFTGREWDPETGLYYYRARYYDPRVGRFVSEDPIHSQRVPNFYAYVANDPVNLMDPSGRIATARRRKKPGPSDNTIVCDGRGGIRLQLPGAVGKPGCLVDCLRAHENVHRKDAQASNPRVCQGVPNGIAIEFLDSDGSELRNTERKACEAQIQCLRNRLNTQCGRDTGCSDQTLLLSITLVEADCAKKTQ